MTRSRRLEVGLTTMLVLIVALCGGGYLYHLHLCRELRRTAAAGDAAAVAKCLDQGAAINTQTEHKETPLLLAVRRGSLPTVRLLLERGAKVNAPDRSGATALWWVAARDGEMPGRAKLAEMLLSRGADPNVQGRRNGGITPLGYSAAKGDPAMIAVLLRYGADPNLKLRRYEPYVKMARRAAYTRTASANRFNTTAEALPSAQRLGFKTLVERERAKQRDAERAVRLLSEATRSKSSISAAGAPRPPQAQDH